MKAVQSSDAKARLTTLLSAVERGESFIITRHGRPIARLVPDPASKSERMESLVRDIEDFRKTAPRLSMDEIFSARREGQK